jgi:hypothetical protein
MKNNVSPIRSESQSDVVWKLIQKLAERIRILNDINPNTLNRSSNTMKSAVLELVEAIESYSELRERE